MSLISHKLAAEQLRAMLTEVIDRRPVHYVLERPGINPSTPYALAVYRRTNQNTTPIVVEIDPHGEVVLLHATYMVGPGSKESRTLRASFTNLESLKSYFTIAIQQP